MLSISMTMHGQVSLPTYNSSDVLSITQSLPAVRQVRGVSKIIVDYEGEWTASQRQAFAYACEIWEEAMPTTFPIKIQAINYLINIFIEEWTRKENGWLTYYYVFQYC